MKNAKRTTVKPAETVLVLRACNPDMSSRNGFVWPQVGRVAEAPDWKPETMCGNGLHGWLWGNGDINASGGTHNVADAKWLVVEVIKSEIVDLTGKVKFPRGTVRFIGSAVDAAAMIQASAPVGTAVIYGTATAGTRGTATAGYAGTATAGESGYILIRKYNPRTDYSWVCGQVGENGIEANVPYKLDDHGKLVKVVK